MDNRIQIIDIFGQFQDKGSGHYYTYPSQPQDEASVEWKRYINDPRELPPTLNQPAYAVWCTSRGWWMAQVQKNPNDTRGGFAMASLFLGQCRPADGTQIVKMLSLVTDRYVNAMNWADHSLADSVVRPGALALLPCPVHPFTLGQPSAYRTYSTLEERDAALTFIDQNGYAAFSRIFILPQAAVAQPAAMQLSRITDITRQIPVKRVFLVQCPQGVRASKTQTIEQERVLLTYSAVGADDFNVEVVAGQNSPYAVCQGNVMIVQPASAAKIPFTKHIHISVFVSVNDSEREIGDFKVQSPDKAVNIRGAVVAFPASMQGELSLTVTHPNFEAREVKVKAQEIGNGNRLRVQTRSKGYKIAFVLDDLGVIESSKTVDKTSQEYRILTEQYRATLTSNRLCLNVPRSQASFNGFITYEPSFWQRMKWPSFVVMALVCLMAAYGIYAAVSLSADTMPFPFSHHAASAAETEDCDTHSRHAHDEAKAPESDHSQDAKAATAEELSQQHDIDYMKRNDAWERDSLLSSRFLRLYDTIKNGEVQTLRQTDWFAGVEPSRINGFWIQVMNQISSVQNNDAAVAGKLQRCDDPELKKNNRDNIAIGFLARELRQLRRVSVPEKQPQKHASAASDPQYEVEE